MYSWQRKVSEVFFYIYVIVYIEIKMDVGSSLQLLINFDFKKRVFTVVVLTMLRTSFNFLIFSWVIGVYNLRGYKRNGCHE